MSIQVSLIESVIKNIPFKKLFDYSFTVDELIALQSKHYYAKAEENLGYYTIAQNDQNYRMKVLELLENFAGLREKGKNISILELGGGTGKFAFNVVKILEEKSISFSYTIIDVSTTQYPEFLQKSSKVQLISNSFTEFAIKNKQEFDILIMNEALDMWAGREILVQEWDDKKVPYNIHWFVVDLEKKTAIKRKDVTKLQIEDETKYSWIKVYENITEKELVPNLKENFRTKIAIPDQFKQLLQQIKLFTIVQDYWSFSEQENGVRMGLYEESVEKTLQKIKFINENEKKTLHQVWVQELDKSRGKKFWIESRVIPFGIVDVTYSPDQSQLFELGDKYDLEIVNMYTENMQQFDDKVFSVGEQENEIFILFTKYAIELQLKNPIT